MRFRLFLLTFCFLLSTKTYSSIISYGNYWHDTNSNIVIGGGLEWLQWSETDNLSYQQALSLANSQYGEGWTLASANQIHHLVNNFELDLFWSPDSTSPSESITPAGSEYQSDKFYNFIQMFGSTYVGSEGNLYSDWTRLGSSAIFGAVDSDTNISDMIAVWSFDNISNISCCNFSEIARIELDIDQGYVNNWGNSQSNYYRKTVGVALVRTSSEYPLVTEVSEPITFFLFVISLAIFVFRRKNNIFYKLG